jgi:hypothetical protein
LIAQENLLRAQAEEAAAATQEARIAALRGQEMQAKAATRAAIGETIGGAAGAAGDIAMLAAMGKIPPEAFDMSFLKKGFDDAAEGTESRDSGD